MNPYRTNDEETCYGIVVCVCIAFYAAIGMIGLFVLFCGGCL